METHMKPEPPVTRTVWTDSMCRDAFTTSGSAVRHADTLFPHVYRTVNINVNVNMRVPLLSLCCRAASFCDG